MPRPSARGVAYLRLCFSPPLTAFGPSLCAYPVRSAHRRVDAGDEHGVERAALRRGKAFAQLRAILDSEDYGSHARDEERVAMGKRGR